MKILRSMALIGLIGTQLFGWSARTAEAAGIEDELNGRYLVSSFTINTNACDGEGQHYKGYENTFVKLEADINVTVPSGQSLSFFHCTDANDSTCGNYWNEWFFETKNPDGSWSSDFSRSISKGLDPNTCSMLYTVKKVSRSGNNVIVEARSYSTPPFQYIAVPADQAECTNIDLVEKYKPRLTRCDNYTKAVLTRR